ncbi:hypothetical protein HII31_09547 [Pseudocercospora fuligena]|uniref:Uncharacterized protein n=1 Tax=Pseudocercospora fuligena TaxID=685502 RepID=A0A8H6VJK7_9PEZI|nr:hypothetical protein HII31_09547 [Pseudocercospora fuligena]
MALQQTTASRTPPCPFLDLPCELRLEIYSYAILDCRHITIGIAKLQGAAHDIIHRQYGGQRSPYAGIPLDCEPVVETRYCAALLDAVKPATIVLTPDTVDPPEDTYEHTRTAYHTLSGVNKQVNEELRTHFAIPTRRQTSLFVQYPHGLHVLHETTPQLLRQSRSVHLAGIYIPRNYCPPRAASLGRDHAPNKERLQGDVVPDNATELGILVKSCFGSRAQHPLEKLELRMYYPGEDSYSTVWGDDDSPVCVALRNIHLGEIGIEIWRGRYGTGVYLTATPTKERKRVVSTVWRKLEEGRRGEPICGSFVLDPNWPDWTADYEASDGPKGDTIISEPVN